MAKKIDSDDIILQIEEQSANVWVPDGLAVPRRNYKPDGEMIMPATNVATCMGKEDYKIFTSSGAAYWSIQQKLKHTVPVTDVEITGSSNVIARKDSDITIGPVLAQNKIGIPVQPGMLAKMSGSIMTRGPGGKVKNSEDNNATSDTFLRFDLWGVAFQEDEYGETQIEGEEEDGIAINLSSYTVQLVVAGTGYFTGYSTDLLTYTVPAMSFVVVPEGVDRLFLTVSYVVSGNYQSLKHKVISGATSLPWFMPSVNPNKEYMAISETNGPRIIVEEAPFQHKVRPHSLSTTKAAFLNRNIFENVFPRFDYNGVPNFSFEDDFTSWTNLQPTRLTISTDNPHTGTKAVKGEFSSNTGEIYSNEYAVTNGDRIYMSGWFRNVNFTGDGGLRLQKKIAGVWSDLASSTIPATNNTWTKYELISTISDPTITHIRWRVAFNGTGTIFFDDIDGAKLIHDNELVFMGAPGVGTSIQVYEWNGTRGALVASSTAAANERKVISVSSTTGIIEVVKPGQTYIGNRGVLLSGSQPNIPQNSWTTVSIKKNDLYPSTTLSGNNIQINQSGNVMIKAYVNFEGESATHLKGVRILRNGTVISTFSNNVQTRGASGQTGTIAVTAGDTISFQAISASTNIAQRTFSENCHFEVLYIQPTAAGNDYYIESCLAYKWEYVDQKQTRLWNKIFVDIIDDVSYIKIERIEADPGVLKVKFCSDQLDPRTSELVQAKKVIRVLGKHYGEGVTTRPHDWIGPPLYTVIFEAEIQRIEVTYDYEYESVITLTAYDGYKALDDLKLGYAFDKMIEYGPIINVLGQVSYIDGIEYTGDTRDVPGDVEYFPSTYGSMTFTDALIMSRNSEKSFVYVNKANELIMKSYLPETVITTFTDGLAPGDLSMGDVKQNIDTDLIVNVIEIEENLLDKKDFIEREASNATPPNRFDKVSGKTRTVTYRDDHSISLYGTHSKKFQVVRGSGDFEDLKTGNFGNNFELWASQLAQDWAYPTRDITAFNVPVKNSSEIEIMSRLDLLDLVRIRYKGEEFQHRIRRMTHEIWPGKWKVLLEFSPTSDQTYWD